MFVPFFLELRKAKVPVSLKEYLTLIEAVARGLAEYDQEKFYYLSRATLVKDERHIDKFDRVFAQVFKGFESPVDGVESNTGLIPEEWLKKLAERHLTPEEMAEIEALGGFEKLMETLKKRLEEQKERHQGGSKWIGTAGTSPFGAYGYNPEGVRIGQDRSRHRRAVKVWDKREFRNFDDTVEIGTRTIKVALRRLRRFAREGAATELDLPGTIRSTAHQGGLLDLKMRPERHNKVKVLLLLDVGGSMDDHVRLVEELFSAAKSEFKHFEHFYFHNCPYEAMWKDNRRRHEDTVPTWQVLRTFGPDWKLVLASPTS
ncbi:MAG: VWA domain-containing protein, partial [Rhodospirillales bacterium]